MVQKIYLLRDPNLSTIFNVTFKVWNDWAPLPDDYTKPTGRIEIFIWPLGGSTCKTALPSTASQQRPMDNDGQPARAGRPNIKYGPLRFSTSRRRLLEKNLTKKKFRFVHFYFHCPNHWSHSPYHHIPFSDSGRRIYKDGRETSYIFWGKLRTGRIFQQNWTILI